MGGDAQNSRPNVLEFFVINDAAWKREPNIKNSIFFGMLVAKTDDDDKNHICTFNVYTHSAHNMLIW